MARLITPSALSDACETLRDTADSVPLAGGTALQMLRRRGEFAPAVLVDLRRLPGIADIERDGDGITIGALVTHRRVERDPLVREVAPVLSDVASQIANVRVRNAATLGGNLAHRDHRLDPPGALMILGARVDVASVDGVRTIAVDDLFEGFADKTLAPGEVIVRVRVPRPPASARIAFAKFKSLGANDWPCAAVAARLDGEDATGAAPVRLALGLTAVAPSPVHLSLDVGGLSLAQALDAADAAVAEAIDPVDDLRGGARFKRRVTRVLAGDVIKTVWSRPAAAAAA